MNEQTVKPCPNPECDANDYTDEDDFGTFCTVLPITKTEQWHVECICGYKGPEASTPQEAERLHNLIASPEPSPTVREAAEKAAANVAKEIDNLRQTYGAVSFMGNCFDEIIANAFRDFVRRDEFEKLRDEFWLVANQDGCAKWAGDKLDAVLRRKP
jgi:hypothetical protein